jgi:DNA-directed RNA polymerase subunit M/transcription elongation factor TFIIS
MTESLFCEIDFNIMTTKITQGETVKICRTCGNTKKADDPILRNYKNNEEYELQKKHTYYNVVVADPTFPSIKKTCTECGYDRMKFVRNPESMRITFICANEKCMSYWDARKDDIEDVNRFHTITEAHW